MFQRLKGSIDSLIAEEQTRQRTQQTAPRKAGSNSSPRRSSSRNISPSRKARKATENEGQSSDKPVKTPDPADFEQPKFAIDDEDAANMEEAQAREKKSPPSVESDETSKPLTDDPTGKGPEQIPRTSLELPTDVRVKLRKVERLEARYQDLLRSYRVAHARVQMVEPFETSLRENTPLTSISDPSALTEYLNQLNVRSDMVMDELKRVTSERDGFKSKLQAAEKSTKEAWDEVAKMKTTHADQIENSVSENPPKSMESSPNVEQAAKMDVPSSVTSNTDLAPLVSPKSAHSQSVAPEVENKEETEEFFSYDSELPRIEGELREKEQEVENLKSELQTVKRDLHVTRESTEGMVHNLEAATLELNGLKDSQERHEKELEVQRSTLQKTIDDLQNKLDSAEKELQELRGVQEQSDLISDELAKAKHQATITGTENNELRDASSLQKERILKLEMDVNDLKVTLESEKAAKAVLEERNTSLSSDAGNLKVKIAELEEKAKEPERQVVAEDKPASSPLVASLPSTSPAPSTAGKKKSKKKKKGVRAGEVVEDKASPSENTAVAPEELASSSGANGAPSMDQIQDLQTQLHDLREEIASKDKQIARLEKKAKDEEDLREEIEGLKDDLINVGQDVVTAKDRVKKLEAEKVALSGTIKTLEDEIIQLKSAHSETTDATEQAHKNLEKDFEELKAKSAALRTDLSAAEQLAAARFKDTMDLRKILQEAQPELISLRSEVVSLKKVKNDLEGTAEKAKKLEAVETDLRAEVLALRKQISEKVSEIKTLAEEVAAEAKGRQKSEEQKIQIQKELAKAEGERNEARDQEKKSSSSLKKTQLELSAMRETLTNLEKELIQIKGEADNLKEEINLKTAQHTSAQSLMGSMRDQSAEMGMQLKEATERIESMEEELADARRLLSERSREGETMRRLLADVEGRADTRVREMRERMEVAIEERDRAEDEANTTGRKRARELEELRAKTRDAERTLKRASDEKEDWERTEKELKRRASEMESKADRAAQEEKDIRQAMEKLQDSLNESEKVARDLEKEKSELGRSVHEMQQRVEKLEKSKKTISEELRSLQTAKSKVLESEGQSSRSSVDVPRGRPSVVASLGNGPQGARTGSMSSRDGQPGVGTGEIDYVYLKNVLLQFLEQKDKKHQKQLIPVLGMLLHFDSKDEQRWMSAISTK